MSFVHFKFKSQIPYDTLTFDGLHISLADLKKGIIAKKKLGKTSDFALRIVNAQTDSGKFNFQNIYLNPSAGTNQNTCLNM